MGITEITSMCIDMEVTNRCNAGCDFCPRDRTPHEGIMRPEVFDRALPRAVELRTVAGRELGIDVGLSFCGLGETLLNRHLAAYVRRAADAGLAPRLCTNASLLTEERGRALVEAGLRHVFVNCGELGEEYDRVYKVPFDRMRENVVRFLALAGDRCELSIVLVDHREDPAYVARVREHWLRVGVTRFFPSPMLNRAGTMAVEGMDFAHRPQHARARDVFDGLGVEPVCAAPFSFPFIGYDGRYYLCSSDWEKQVALGDVWHDSILSTLERRLRAVAEGESICQHCCHDPVNHLTAQLRKADLRRPDAREPTSLAALHAARTQAIHDLVARSRARGLTAPTSRPGAGRFIPVTAV